MGSIKNSCSVSLFVLLLGGCVKVDTDPQPIFNEVKQDISERSGQNLYWDSSLSEMVTPVTMETLLAEKLDEEAVVSIALLNNKALQAFYENLGISKARLAQAGLLKNPVFSFANKFSTKSGVSDIIDMALVQNLLEALLIPLKKKMAREELEAAKSRVISKVLGVIAETKIAYYQFVAAEQIWDLKKQILLATELAYEAAQKLYEAGNVKDLDVSIYRSFYEQPKLEVASLEIAVLDAREKLNVLMGLWGCDIEWQASLCLHEIPEKEADFHSVENDAILQSADLKASYSEMLATAAEFGIDTSRFVFPQFDAGASTEREEGIWYAGPAFSLALPFFDFGQANSALAKSAILQKWNEYTALAIEIRSKARSARFHVLNSFRQAEYLKKVMVPLSEQITHYTLLQHNAMQMGVFDLLSAKQKELEKKFISSTCKRITGSRKSRSKRF